MECMKAFKAELVQWFEVAMSDELLKSVRSSRSYDVTTPPPDVVDSEFIVSRSELPDEPRSDRRCGSRRKFSLDFQRFRRA